MDSCQLLPRGCRLSCGPGRPASNSAGEAELVMNRANRNHKKHAQRDDVATCTTCPTQHGAVKYKCMTKRVGLAAAVARLRTGHEPSLESLITKFARL